jgi:hypothetical protein
MQSHGTLHSGNQTSQPPLINRLLANLIRGTIDCPEHAIFTVRAIYGINPLSNLIILKSAYQP